MSDLLTNIVVGILVILVLFALFRYLVIGTVIALVLFAILIPLYRRFGAGPYSAHGGKEYRPGVLY